MMDGQKNNVSKYNTSQKTLIDQALSSAKECFRNFLEKKSLRQNIIDDIVKSTLIPKYPSAALKMKSFLVSLGVYPTYETDFNKKMLKWINTVRNYIVHTGDVPSDKELSNEMVIQVSLGITMLTLSISTLFFAKEILCINEPEISRLQTNVSDYFSTGKFNNQDIFNETYLDYVERIEATWLEEGCFT